MVKLTLAVYGFKNSGKTALIEFLTRELTNRGFRVATMKHVYENFFELDVPGKDSWRHKKAGAITVGIVSASRIAIIDDSISDLKENFQRVLRYLKENSNLDVLIMEGFHNLTSDDDSIKKIIIVRDIDEFSFFNQLKISGILGFLVKTEKPIITNISKGKIYQKDTEILRDLLSLLG